MNDRKSNSPSSTPEDDNSRIPARRRHLHHVPKSAAGHALLDLRPFQSQKDSSFGYIADDGFSPTLLSTVAGLILKAFPGEMPDTNPRETNPQGSARVFVSLHSQGNEVKVELATTPFEPQSEILQNLEKCVEQINFLLAHGKPAPVGPVSGNPHSLN